MNDDTQSDLIYWLTLTQLPNAGPLLIKKLLSHCHSAKNICKASQTTLQNLKLNAAQIYAIRHPNSTWINTALQWQKQSDHHIISLIDVRYPALLAEIASPPLLLYIKGKIDTLTQPQIAVVGSRNPSFTGLELSTEFGFLLSQAGFTITSGLALGIDTASHTGALNAGGKTIAVLGSGLQHIYPKRNAALAEKIASTGCLVSEFPLDTTPVSHNFPRRNRIISGLSLGTLVIEAALKSGSLITAHFAAEQGREVFAIPNSIRNPTAKGCLALIQNGAKCVTCLEDILEEIQPVSTSTVFMSTPSIDSNEHQTALACTDQQVLACIDNEMTTIDQICARSKLSTHLITAALLRLELNGVIKRQFGGFVKSIENERRRNRVGCTNVFVSEPDVSRN